MTYAVLDPGVISITEQDWACEESRDDFLEHFNIIMQCIGDNDEIALAWNALIDEVIWSAPQKPPWRQDRVWANNIIPIMYEKLMRSAQDIDIVDDGQICTITPDIISDRSDLLAIFKQILATLHGCCDNILIPFGLKNIPIVTRQFSIDDEPLRPEPMLLTNEKDFLALIDVAKLYWPKSINDAEQLKQGIAILLRREYDIKTPLVGYTFCKDFTRKLAATNSDKRRILAAIVKRLSMSTTDAGRDGALHDEKIKAQRRFRVTKEKRIHYQFNEQSNGSIIEFLMFYDAGEHDDGL
ncbi:MAG: hypothetical protein ACI8WB_001151 [Phenylobacterium sp.]|jgi:hypothetical protein